MGDERPLSRSRDYSLELEMAPEDNETPPSSPGNGFSSTMPTGHSPSAFGGTTFGTGTFSGTRPSTLRRRDSKEVKTFGSHRGIPTPGTLLTLPFRHSITTLSLIPTLSSTVTLTPTLTLTLALCREAYLWRAAHGRYRPYGTDHDVR